MISMPQQPLADARAVLTARDGAVAEGLTKPDFPDLPDAADFFELMSLAKDPQPEDSTTVVGLIALPMLQPLPVATKNAASPAKLGLDVQSTSAPDDALPVNLPAPVAADESMLSAQIPEDTVFDQPKHIKTAPEQVTVSLDISFDNDIGPKFVVKDSGAVLHIDKSPVPTPTTARMIVDECSFLAKILPLPLAQSALPKPLVPHAKTMPAPDLEVSEVCEPEPEPVADPEPIASTDALDMSGLKPQQPKGATDETSQSAEISLQGKEPATGQMLAARSDPAIHTDPQVNHSALQSAVLPPSISSTLLTHATAALQGPVQLVLNPEELGKVRFEIHQKGDHVTVFLAAERPETLEMLRRHSDQLVQEFRSAGFTGASLSFAQSGGQQGKKPQKLSTEAFDPALANVQPHPFVPASPSQTGLKPGLNIRL